MLSSKLLASMLWTSCCFKAAEAAAAVLWASCFCQAVLSSYGLKLPSACASSSLRCKGIFPSPHCKLAKLPSILPDDSSSEAVAAGPSVKAPCQAAASKACCARAALQNGRCLPRLYASSWKLSSKSRLRKLWKPLDASKLARHHPCQAPSR